MKIIENNNITKNTERKKITIKKILKMIQIAETEADKQWIIHVMKLEGITPDDLKKSIADLNKEEER